MALPYYLIGLVGENSMYLRKSPDHFERLAIEIGEHIIKNYSP
ncbi:hypothetical protein [Methylotuvimicrobium sp. KM2]